MLSIRLFDSSSRSLACVVHLATALRASSDDSTTDLIAERLRENLIDLETERDDLAEEIATRVERLAIVLPLIRVHARALAQLDDEDRSGA